MSASPGVNLEAARFGIGHEAHLLDALTSIKGPMTGRFPDPEPLRLFREAQRSGRPVFFLEPNLDDGLGSHLSPEAKERTDCAGSSAGCAAAALGERPSLLPLKA